MTSFEEVIKFLFGESFDVSKVVAIIVAIYAVIKSITEWRAKRALLKKEQEETALTKELKLAREENKELKKAIGKLGDVIITSYLSSNTIPVEVKREIGKFGDELNKVAEIPLAETTKKLVEVVSEVVPESNINEHKEELEEATKLAEEVIDSANELAQDAIDKISI